MGELYRNHLEVLERAECLELVATVALGRLAYDRGGVLVVIPINVGLVDDRLYFHLGTGAALNAIYHQALVTVEIDQFDLDRATGWSVNVVGVAKEVPPGRIQPDMAELRSWVRRAATRLFALDTEHLSGRRVLAADDTGSTTRPAPPNP